MTSTIRQVSDMSCGVTSTGTSFDLTGPADAPVLALIHGLGLSRGVWDDHVPALAAHYRVLRYDLVGHGDSAPAQGTVTLTTYADQLAELLDHLDTAQCTVIGFSIGGMINRRFALDHGERLDALVILNSPHDRGEDGQKMVEDRARSVRDHGAFSTFDSALKRWFTPPYLAASTSKGPALVRAWREQADPEGYAQAAWILAHGVRELIAPVRLFTVPTLIMTCENDSGSTPAMSRAIAKDCADAEVVIVPDLQHLGLMEQPDAFTAPILDFLARKLT